MLSIISVYFGYFQNEKEPESPEFFVKFIVSSIFETMELLIALLILLQFGPLLASPIFGPDKAPIKRRENNSFMRATQTSNFLRLTRQSGTLSGLRPRQIADIQEQNGQAAYTAEVEIADTTFSLLVDTGSSDTWMTAPNTTCFDPFAETACTFPTHLSVSKSEKWLAPFYASYLDGSNVTGGLIERPVSIAGITIPDQIVGLVDQAFIGRTDGSMDGLLGLGGIGGTGASSYLPVFDSIVAEGLLAENSFSITLFGTADFDQYRDSGILAFGGIPDTIMPTSDWGVTPILTDTGYAIEVDGFKFEGASKITLSENQRFVLVDTGTFLTRLARPVAEAVWNLLPGNPRDECSGDANEKCTDAYGFWKIPCNGEVPSFSVVIGGVAFAISDENLIVSTTIADDYCISGVVPQADNVPGILGVTFLKNVVVVHDFTDLLEPKMEVATYELLQ